MATLVAKTRAITQSTTNETSNAQVIEFLSDGASYLISHVPKELLRAYASETTGATSSTGIAYGNNTVLGVRRGSYECEQVDKMDAGWLESGSGSYMVPTAAFPKYYDRAGSIYIKPNPSSTAIGYASLITVPTLTSASATIFGNLEHIVVNRASGYDFKALGSYYSEKGSSAIGSAVTGISSAFTNFTSTLPDDWDYTLVVTNIEDALTQAQNLIDGTVTTNNAVDWLDDEDVEMVQGIVGTASQEINRAVQEINKIRLYIENETAERGADLAKAKTYLEEVTARLNQAQNGLAYIQKAQQMFTESDKMFAMSTQEVETYIKNSSEMIAIQAGSK